MRTFKADIQNELYNAFGNCTVDYSICVESGLYLRDVTLSIVNGPVFDIICVGICILDLLDPGLNLGGKWNVVPNYPESLDQGFPFKGYAKE